MEEKSSVNQRIEGLIFGVHGPYVEVSFGKTVNPDASICA